MTPPIADTFICPDCDAPVDSLAGRLLDEIAPVQLWHGCSECGWSSRPTPLPRTLVPEDWRDA